MSAATTTATRPMALVTGAGGGIGRAVVAELARAGTRVVAVDRDARALGALVVDLGLDDDLVVTRTLDVTSAEDVERVVSEVEESVGPLTRLVNAAGVLRPGAVLDLTVQDLLETVAVNLVGTVVVSQAVVRRMARRGAGAVVTVGSNAAHVPRAGMSAYAASKAAAEMFTRCLALETARHGIRCNVVSPGSTDTPMLRALWADGGSETATVDGDLATFRTGIPLGRVADPQDIARVVAFLLSDGARHVTMQALTVDGGATLGV